MDKYAGCCFTYKAHPAFLFYSAVNTNACTAIPAIIFHFFRYFPQIRRGNSYPNLRVFFINRSTCPAKRHQTDPTDIKLRF